MKDIRYTSHETTTMPVQEVKEILQQSAHLSHTPNNFIGFGIPDCEKITMILKTQSVYNPHYILSTNKNKIKIETDSVQHVVLFHKSNPTHVFHQSILGMTKLKRKNEASRLKNKKNTALIKIVRHKNGKFTTIDTGKKTFEVEWL